MDHNNKTLSESESLAMVDSGTSPPSKPIPQTKGKKNRGSCLTRIVSLLVGLWMFCDIALDFNQTHIYYHKAYDPQNKDNLVETFCDQAGNPQASTIAATPTTTQTTTKSSNPKTTTKSSNPNAPIQKTDPNAPVSPLYFAFSLGCLILFPMIYTLPMMPMVTCNWVLKVLLYPIIALLIAYIYIPMVAVADGLSRFLFAQAIDQSEDMSEKNVRVVAAGAFEKLFEAIPQFILNLVFLINNWVVIRAQNQSYANVGLFGHTIRIFTPMASLIFSAGSILLGIFKIVKNRKIIWSYMTNPRGI